MGWNPTTNMVTPLTVAETCCHSVVGEIPQPPWMRSNLVPCGDILRSPLLGEREIPHQQWAHPLNNEVC